MCIPYMKASGWHRTPVPHRLPGSSPRSPVTQSDRRTFPVDTAFHFRRQTFQEQGWLLTICPFFPFQVTCPWIPKDQLNFTRKLGWQFMMVACGTSPTEK